MIQLDIWSEEKAQETLSRRLAYCKQRRRSKELGWRENEAILYQGAMGDVQQPIPSFTSLSELYADTQNIPDSRITVNYTFKYLRFLHAQMSANPPSTIVKPTSMDFEDEQAAKAADNIGQWLRRKYDLQEKVDLTTLPTLIYGTGILRTKWDTLKGDLLKVHKKTKRVLMAGDFNIRPVNIWKFWFDPDAKLQEDINYTFEEHELSLEEACYMFPEKKDLIIQRCNDIQKSGKFMPSGPDARQESMPNIKVYEYIEKGRPWNGMLGRTCMHLEDGTLLTSLNENDYLDAELPYHILTDIDVPNQIYGKTFLDYLVTLQDVLTSIDSSVLEAIQAHSNPRLVVYSDSEVETTDVKVDNWYVMTVKGSAQHKPDYINPPQLMPALNEFRAQIVAALADLSGVNEEMQGKVNREMSALSMQTAIDAGNLIRRRLFNKYTLFVKRLYMHLFGMVQQHWSDEHKVEVVGKEGAFSVAYYSAADLKGGFDIEVEYGASFSLDPSSRREEILQLIPHLEKAGMSPVTILKMMRFNEVSGLVDLVDLAGRRQLEIFEEMISSYEENGILEYIAPEEEEAHAEMLTAAMQFRMSAAFKYLAPEVKSLINQHIKERKEAAAAVAAPAPAPVPGMEAGGIQMPAGLPPMPGL